MGTIVLQENDDQVLDIIRIALEIEGYNIHATSEYGESLMNLIAEVHPDVILLDFKLNGMACKKACSDINTRFKHMPVIALSCNVDIEEYYDKFGFAGYLKKPFELHTLYSLINESIRRHHMAG